MTGYYFSEDSESKIRNRKRKENVRGCLSHQFHNNHRSLGRNTGEKMMQSNITHLLQHFSKGLPQETDD